MISFLLFGRSLSVYLFSGLFYTKNWFPHPLLATSTPKLSGSNSSHGRSTCASEASCWSVDYFSNFFQTLTVFPWNIQASRDSEEDWQTIWRSKTVPHFNFQQEKYPSLQLEPSSHHEPTTPGHCLCHWLLLPSTRCATTTATTQALKKAPTLKGPGSMVETCNKKMRCFVWLFDSFRFLKDKGILVVCDLVAFWFGWFYENLRCVPNQSLDHSMGWQQKYTKMSVLSQCFLWPKKKQGWKQRLCVWSLSKLSYNWGWWLVWFGIQNRQTSKRSRTGPHSNPFPIPHLFRCKARSKTEISGGRKKDWPSKKRANLKGSTSWPSGTVSLKGHSPLPNTPSVLVLLAWLLNIHQKQ